MTPHEDVFTLHRDSPVLGTYMPELSESQYRDHYPNKGLQSAPHVILCGAKCASVMCAKKGYSLSLITTVLLSAAQKIEQKQRYEFFYTLASARHSRVLRAKFKIHAQQTIALLLITLTECFKIARDDQNRLRSPCFFSWGAYFMFWRVFFEYSQLQFLKERESYEVTEIWTMRTLVIPFRLPAAQFL